MLCLHGSRKKGISHDARRKQTEKNPFASEDEPKRNEETHRKKIFINEIKLQFVVVTKCHQHHVIHGPEFPRLLRVDEVKNSNLGKA